MAGVLGAATSAAIAYEPPQYILIPCGDLASDDQQILMFGINNLGQTVGLRLDANSGPFQAMLWLPFPAYSENEGLLSLDAKTSFGNSATQSGDGTIAFDINDAGMAVGSYDNSNPNPVVHDAVIWKVATESDESVVGRFAGYSINDDTPALVTGGSGECWETVLPFLPSSPHTGAAFVHEVGGTTTPLSGPGFAPVGYGVADASAGLDALIVGHADCIAGPECPGQICDAIYNGVYWSDHEDSSRELEPYARINGISAFVVGHAAELDNQVTHVVGFGHDGMDNEECRIFGLYWDVSLDSEPMELPLLVDAPEQDELAFDVRNGPDEDDLEIVGRNFTLRKAIAWRYDNSANSWTTVDLSGADSDVVDDLHDFDFLACATGINDNGWITAWGPLDETPIKYRSAVLVPVDDIKDFCPADIANSETQYPDGVVNLFDLLLLLDNWGTSGAGAAISASGSGSNVVDLFDLLDLIDAWGNCINADPRSVNSIEDEVTATSLTMNDWDDFVDVMTDPNEDPEVKENWSCWMKNTLSACPLCPPCPGQNPFK